MYFPSAHPFCAPIISSPLCCGGVQPYPYREFMAKWADSLPQGMALLASAAAAAERKAQGSAAGSSSGSGGSKSSGSSGSSSTSVFQLDVSRQLRGCAWVEDTEVRTGDSAADKQVRWCHFRTLPAGKPTLRCTVSPPTTHVVRLC
jgi:hypothetical protein